MKRISAIAIAVLLLIATASTQPPAAKPGLEHKKLDYFVGNWTTEADVKPGPMGPGGKMTVKEDAKWMDGGFFVVIHSAVKGGAMGDSTGVAYMGYDPEERVYTYDAFNSKGEVVHAKGHVDGDTWSWANDMKMGGQSLKGRYTTKILSPTSYTYKFEMSPDGTTWNVVMDGKQTKGK
jgi:hypothetical protein